MRPPLPVILSAPPLAEETPAGPVRGEISRVPSKLPDEVQLQQVKQDPDETLRMIRIQYQEALYMSQVSNHWLSPN